MVKIPLMVAYLHFYFVFMLFSCLIILFAEKVTPLFRFFFKKNFVCFIQQLRLNNASISMHMEDSQQNWHTFILNLLFSSVHFSIYTFAYNIRRFGNTKNTCNHINRCKTAMWKLWVYITIFLVSSYNRRLLLCFI